MKEFKRISRFRDNREHIERDLYEDAGICEVHRTDWRNLGRFSTDFVGEYVGDDLAVIPDNAEVRWVVMNAEEYEAEMLNNCSGATGEDFVCEETRKVLVVQFYDPCED